MASTWTTTLPQGTTRIRKLPNICQDRWTNIQNGEVPSTRWQLALRAGNPGTIATVGQIFTKDGGAGAPELFYKDDASNTTQITKAGGIGTPAQVVNGSTYISLQSDLITTFTNTQDGFCSAAGRVASDGTQQAGYQISATAKIGTGNYRVTYSTAMTTAQGYVIVVTPRDLGNTSDAYCWNVTAQDASKFEVKFRKFNSGSLTFDSVDVGFTFSVFMSRI